MSGDIAKKTRKRRPSRRKKPESEHNIDNVDGEIIDDGGEKPKPKKSSRRIRTNAIDYADDDAMKPSAKTRRINGTILSNSKPSYCLKRGVGTLLKNSGASFKAEYNKRLRKLLKKLIRRHNWTDAAAVLGVLLKATEFDKSFRHNRFKYWAAMEILKEKEGGDIRFEKIRSVYELWMKKTPSKARRSVKERITIQLECVLYCLTDGEITYHDALGLMQERDFESDPISNLVVGLIFYELWYSDLPEKWKRNQSEYHEARENFDEYDANESQENNLSVELNSDTSVANDKQNTKVDSSQERVPMDVDNLQTQSPERSVSQGDSYVYSAEGSEDMSHDIGRSASIFQAPGLPPWLLPLKLPPMNDNLDGVIYDHRDLENDYYRNAVKHLQVALHSTPPMAEALEPLIQVLLMGDRVNEAFQELDNFFDDSATALKLRFKVGLLEHFDRGNHLQLSSCYEEILEVDPTCSNSLVKLINMHQRGDYGTVKLVNMLGLYLDATYAEFNIWKALASSVNKLSQCAGDQTSICSYGNGEEIKQSNTGHSNQIPDLFTHGKSGKTWRLRCRWWLTRHFSSSILSLEIASGELQLLTYKAAVAAFLYGPEFKYVTKATQILENETTNHDLLSVLRIHVQNYVGIYKC